MAMLKRKTFQKAFLLYFLGHLGKVYSDLRLQKTVFLFEKENLSLRPFTFIRHYLGPYSFALERCKNTLISLGWIGVKDMGKTNAYYAELSDDLFKNLVSLEKMPQFIQKIRRKKNADLLTTVYELPEMKKVKSQEIIVRSTLAEEVEVPNLSEEGAQDIELGLNANFLKLLQKASSLPSRRVDWRNCLAGILR